MDELIQNFYTAFQERDATKMNACYHSNVTFSDPVFGTLKGEQAKKMWRMLCKNGKDLRVEFSDVKATEKEASANWKAQYTFSKTGRAVTNTIRASFVFKDGKIIEHHDEFNIRNWAGQALGWKGKLLGGTSFFRKKLRKQVLNMLDRFEK
ncbi:nuclear transport factor 2 family protein [Aquimarina hainanensis]|uniref:Nuclear transport factor 2 family protein n=1 Tax=Aquimarina hainanensis TaxID=1578017 RepID=A0ABW5N432_9FLAO|nr:nuclear transport factor 2 family protein [Aquimarina sp. TRL1]QKX04755.1 nuclear transport factor 2 family protein [Aquimarina sp. TRL1]